MMTFDELVAESEQTCQACPTQYQGKLKDGRCFYFRYRSATACLGLGATVMEAVDDAISRPAIGYGEHPLDGVVNQKEFESLFVLLMMLR